MAPLVTHQPVIGTGSGLQVGSEAGAALATTPITALHAARDELWVLADRGQLHRVTGDGSELVASLGPSERGTCVVVHRGTVWVGGDDAALWRLAGNELEPVAAFGRAPTSDDWHTPWGGAPSVFSMASHDGGDGSADTHLYVSVHVGGIMRTSDDGESWAPTIDLHDDVHQVTVDERGVVWAATGMRGLAESTDRGATWRYHTDGLHARYLLTVAATSDGVLVGASSGHAGRDGAIYRFDGDRFERRLEGLPDDFGGAVGPRQLAAAGRQAIAALPRGDVYTSADAGRTWTRVATQLEDVSEVALRPT